MTRRSKIIDSEARPLRGLDRLFRTAFVIIPIGVIGNVAFSYFTTDRSFFATIVDELRRREREGGWRIIGRVRLGESLFYTRTSGGAGS